MTSQSLEIVRHVIWTSVTGGWFYDPQQHAAVNLIQLYFWMFLFCCPFLIAIYSIMNTVAWASYSLTIFTLFSIIKYINHVLHEMFDTCECIEETDQCADSMGGAKSSEPLDSIEMSIVEAARKRSATVSDTPPAECVSRISDQTLPDMGTGLTALCDRIDHQVDVHRSAVGLSALDRSGVDQPLRRVTQRNMSSTSFLDHPIDLISELPEEELELEASEPQLAYAEPLQLDYSTRGLPFGLLMAASEAGGTQHARDGGGMFDLPALLNAVRERMQGSLPPGYFRRTLSVSDTSDSTRPTAATAVTGGGQFTDLNAGRSLVELAVRATAPARSTRSASLTASSDRPCESCTSPRPSGYVSAAQAVDESNLSGSEDEAKDSDSPLLGGSSSKMATVPDDVSAINVWVKDASEGASLSDGTSLHSLTGLDRLFCEDDDNVSQTDAVSTAEQGAVPKNRHRQTRAGGAVLAGRWHASSGHRRRAIRIREGGRGGRSGRSSSPHHQCRRRRAPAAGPDALPPLPSASSTTTTAALPPVPGTHLATSHEDTSIGAVHYFQDEFGNWMTYAFNESGFTGPIPAASEWSINSTLVDSPAFKSPGLVGIHGTGADPRGHDGGEAPGPLMDYLHSSLGLQPAGTTSAPPPPKHHYRFNLGRQISFKVRFERLFLLALMDRSVLLVENVASVLLALLTSILAAAVLHSGIYQDLGIFFFSFALASCQYCLVKSVQPDAASPTHGHNRVVVFSRAVYFCVLCALTLSVQQLQRSPRHLRLYSVWLTSEQLLSVTLQLLRYLLLLMPLLFTVGLLPQTDTFLHYLLEQLDRHLFGGTAMTSLPAALYSFSRSVVAVAALYGFAYGGLRENGDSPTAQHILFSIFCGLLVTCCYHLSRSASDPTQLFRVVRRYACADLERTGPDDAEEGERAETEAGGDAKPSTAGEASKSDGPSDPLPDKMLHATRVRLKSDALACVIIAVMFFAIHCSTVFSSLRPVLERVLWSLAVGTGVLLHYLLPQLRKQLPWLCFAHPILAPAEYQQYEVSGPARIMCFERVLVWAGFFERHILYPLVFLSALTTGPPHLVQKLGLEWATLVVVVCAMKNLRAAYIDPGSSYMVLLFTILLFEYDLFGASETLLVDFFFVSILYDKMVDLLLKLQFVTTYIAPWQITWGSAFHAFAQPFSVPHSAVLIFQAIVSAVLSSPLNPFLGSAVFISSYVRPVKFWERNYNTRRVDHSNTRLSLHLDRNPGANDNNLNSIFYEHLTRSLQHSLYGDILLGRWGEVKQGDCFVLASDYLNCLVHIIELGNGLVTFQMRGLEFRGTYCQQREVEAISEGVEEDAGCCCCEPGRLPHLLSANQIFNQRWLAWQVTASKYVVEGYSITDNSATSMLQVFDLRKVLIAYYVKSIIYYAVRSPSLEKWLSSHEIMSHILEHTADPNFVDVDPIFNMNIDEDYDFRASGITKHSFCNVYFDWIKYCVEQRSQPLECARDSPVVLLCLALSLLGRRALCVASHHSHSSVEFFLYGLHALFKGDFRITSLRDEWVFYDMDLLKKVVSPSIRMSLKLHQDHFMSPEEYELSHRLYEAIHYYDEHLVIAHEGDPAWRNAILSGAPSLLALRHIIDDGSDQYKVIMLNKRHLSFRLIKLNRECVRGLWSGQQQELIFLRNRNSERGSIQNAKQALRNIINSSCDQPIGYPIYVSPLTTSFAETSEQLVNVLGGSISFDWVKRQILTAWQRLCARCGEGCASGGSVRQEESVRYTAPCTVHLGSQLSGTFPPHGLTGANKPTSSSLPPALTSTGGAQHSCGCPARGSQPILQSFRRPIASATQSDASPLVVFFQSPPLLAGASPARAAVRPVRTAQQSPAPALFLPALPPPPPALPPAPSLPSGARVRLINGDVVYDTINQGRRSDVQWPHDDWRKRGGKNFWGNWVPDGRLGTVVHYWCPSHPQAVHRSHVDKTIVLLRMEGPRYVPVAEVGCELVVDISPENERETGERSDEGAASV